MYSKSGKRVFDICVAALLLLILSPVFIVAAVLIKVDSPGPIFFKQRRVGMNLIPFTILKFRTMTNEKREVTRIIGKANGVTKSGYWMRRFKIDELPQLINVLRGEMSLIGPRPSIIQHLNQMTKVQKKRYEVRPGLTGLAQVSGNIYLSWEDRFKYDLLYISKLSFFMDLKILWRTAGVVLNGEQKFLQKPQEIKKPIN